MSLSTTPAIKAMLTNQLGPVDSVTYFSTLNSFLSGSISRTEFFDVMCTLFAAPEGAPPIPEPPPTTAKESAIHPALIHSTVALNEQLVQLHNALIISLFDATTHHRRQNPFAALNLAAVPALPPVSVADDGTAVRPSKRRRVLYPPQAPEEGGVEISLRSKKLKRWVLGLGKKERERVKSLAIESGDVTDVDSYIEARRKRDADEIARERGVILLNERADPPGFRVPLQLSTLTRAPSNIQAVSDRISLICAQHGMVSPQRPVAALLVLALEAKLKQLISHAISLTASSRAINSISTASATGSFAAGVAREKQEVLTLSSFITLFTITPSSLPNGSAAAYKLLACGDSDIVEEVGADLLKDRQVSDPRWQLMALLAERSAVREALAGTNHA